MRIAQVKHIGFVAIFVLIVSGLIAANTQAAEVLVEKDIVETVTTEEAFIKTADNFIVLFDTSGSMSEPYKDTGMTKAEAAKKILKERNETLPDLGYNAGLYVYTPFNTIYPMQPYDREKFGRAFDKVPKAKTRPTPLGHGIKKLDSVLEKLEGRTAVFIFSDGQRTQYTDSIHPVDAARQLADKYNVCFYVISSAKKKAHKKLLQEISSTNQCSNVIPFDALLGRTEYFTGPLFIISETKVVAAEEMERVVGLKIDNILFDFGSSQIRPEFHDELNELGKFLQINPEAYVVLAGFTDSVGPEEYNMWLSHRRAESVSDYLVTNFNTDPYRIVVQWYGETNPVTSNDTAAGRSKNRRVVSVIAGL